MRLSTPLAGASLLAALLPLSAAAQTAETPIPAPLRPWVPWVLAAHPELPCPLLDGERLCAWPGRLELAVDARGGRFALEVTADQELDLELPGSAAHWPVEVTSDGRRALTRRREERPAVGLEAGTHRVEGRFRWSRLPEWIEVPPSLALVALTVEGAPVPRPRREPRGQLWLQASREVDERDRLDLRVHRRIEDGVPVRLTTRLELRVSGRARQVELADPLPAGFVPTSLSGQLPLRWGEGGVLAVQLRPGTWQVEVEGRSSGPVDEIQLAARPEPWPGEETWVFAADPAVRAVQIGGAPGVDPQRTTLPAEWRGLPAFQLTPGGSLTFQELRRGEAEPPPDEVHVNRTIWLSQRGDRYVVRDEVTGELHRGGRFEAVAPAALGRVSLRLDGEARDQVITLGEEAQRGQPRPGVEVRERQLALAADLTYPRRRALPAVGWNRDAQSLAATLYLPPGWTLLGSTGVDRTDGAWIDRWSLLDLFLLLVLALASWKLDGPRWGVAVLLVLGASWHEPYGGGLVAWSLVLLPLRALARVVTEGRFAKAIRVSALLVGVVLAIQVFLFASSEWRTGLFPQLEPGGYPGVREDALVYQGGAAAPEEAPAALMMSIPAAPEIAEPSPKRALADSLASRSRQVDPNAVVQTGPGVPSWRLRPVSLTWSGPVGAAHRIRLFLLSPGWELLLSLLRIAGVLWIAWRWITPGPAALRGLLPAASLLFLALLPRAAAAQEPPGEPATPPASLLAALEKRLTAPPPCHPDCVELPRLRLAAEGEELTVEAAVDAAALTAWRLPGPVTAWAPRRVVVDGAAARALRLGEDDFLELRLTPGPHTVELAGPAAASFELRFPVPPRTLEWRGEGWALTGYQPDEPPPRALRLDRRLPAAAGAAEATIELAPWLELTRELDVGLPWRVHNELRRVGAASSLAVARVPLLPGEAVTSAGVTVEGGVAIVALEAGETSRRWESTLEETAGVTLTAPEESPWFERWQLACSPIWSCTLAGTPPIRQMEDGRWHPTWRPWPGESVTLSFNRPPAAAGATTTVDHVALHLEPGRRLLEGDLTLELRTSRGGEQRITLPAAATLRSFKVDGADLPVQAEDGEVVYTVAPGARRVELAWRQDDGALFFERAPAVALGGAAVNVEVRMTVPPNRWLLWAGGPGWGPVVLFWQYLFAVLLAAWVLGRWTATPLRARDWFLLGLGLTQLPLAAALAVAAWLVLLGWRHRVRPHRWWSYDLMQLALAVLALVGVISLYVAVHSGLLLQPDMQIAGGSTHGLTWYVEQSDGALPRPWLLWLPLWVWRAVMLLWSLWLASRLLRWLPWSWERWTLGPLLAGPQAFRRWREGSESGEPA